MRVALINMPFARLGSPSLALTQLASRLTGTRTGAAVDVLDLNHFFGAVLGVEFYNYVVDQYANGLGDWLFRHVAFPDQADNAGAFLARYYPGTRPETVTMRAKILSARDSVGDALRQAAQRYALAEYDVVGLTSMFAQN